jgi:hypothetical protein
MIRKDSWRAQNDFVAIDQVVSSVISSLQISRM